MSDPEEGAGPATDYLRMFALTSLAYVWVKYIDIANRKMNDDPKGFYKAKIATGSFFLNKVLPETGALMSSIMSELPHIQSMKMIFLKVVFHRLIHN